MSSKFYLSVKGKENKCEDRVLHLKQSSWEASLLGILIRLRGVSDMQEVGRKRALACLSTVIGCVFEIDSEWHLATFLGWLVIPPLQAQYCMITLLKCHQREKLWWISSFRFSDPVPCIPFFESPPLGYMTFPDTNSWSWSCSMSTGAYYLEELSHLWIWDPTRSMEKWIQLNSFNSPCLGDIRAAR